MKRIMMWIIPNTLYLLAIVVGSQVGWVANFVVAATVYLFFVTWLFAASVVVGSKQHVKKLAEQVNSFPIPRIVDQVYNGVVIGTLIALGWWVCALMYITHVAVLTVTNTYLISFLLRRSHEKDWAT